MNLIYLETCFQCDDPGSDWPDQFAIITAYSTTGEIWTDAENVSADRALELELRQRVGWVRRITGYSPTTGHAEPGWAVCLGFDAACDLGHRYRQDAIYHVTGDVLSVSYCDSRRGRVTVGDFRSRVHGLRMP